MKKFSLLSTFLFLFLFSMSAYAQADRQHRKGKMRDMLESLDLTQEQFDKLKEFRQANKKAGKRNRGEVRELREKMKTAFLNNAPDSELNKIHQEIQTIMNAKIDQRIQKMIFLKNILTKEQREKFVELRMSHHKGPGRK